MHYKVKIPVPKGLVICTGVRLQRTLLIIARDAGRIHQSPRELAVTVSQPLWEPAFCLRPVMLLLLSGADFGTAVAGVWNSGGEGTEGGEREKECRWGKGEISLRAGEKCYHSKTMIFKVSSTNIDT